MEALAFSHGVGFRCGIAQAYHAFDLERHESLPLIVEPLHVMDTVICRRTQGVGSESPRRPS